MALFGCVFCTRSFLKTMLAMLANVWFCRIFILFLNDVEIAFYLGGLYFVSSLKHVQQGLFIYVALMVGVFYYRGYDCFDGDSFASACDCFGMLFGIHCRSRFFFHLITILNYHSTN